MGKVQREELQSEWKEDRMFVCKVSAEVLCWKRGPKRANLNGGVFMLEVSTKKLIGWEPPGEAETQ